MIILILMYKCTYFMKIAIVRIVIMIMQVDCVIKVLTQWLAKGVWDSKEEPTVDKWVFVFYSWGEDRTMQYWELRTQRKRFKINIKWTKWKQLVLHEKETLKEVYWGFLEGQRGIAHISHYRHNRRWCTFFQAGVLFSSENAKGTAFLQSLFREYKH